MIKYLFAIDVQHWIYNISIPCTRGLPEDGPPDIRQRLAKLVHSALGGGLNRTVNGQTALKTDFHNSTLFHSLSGRRVAQDGHLQYHGHVYNRGKSLMAQATGNSFSASPHHSLSLY
jgi:hypothetical protein